jgi:DNA-binding NarL/FixJ family response regulator
MTKRVAVLAASALVREGLQRLVRDRFESAGAADSIAQLRHTATHLPDVVIVDHAGLNDAAPLRELVDAGIKLVILSDADPATLAPLVTAGAAWLPRAAREEEIVAAIEAVGAGLTALRAETLGDLLLQPPGWSGAVARREVELIEPLTARERQVLALMAAGFANKRIGQTLGISEHTAKFHVARILGKLDAATRAEAVAIGLRDGVIER